MVNLLLSNQKSPDVLHLVVVERNIAQDHRQLDETGRQLFKDLVDEPGQDHIAVQGGINRNTADVDGCS